MLFKSLPSPLAMWATLIVLVLATCGGAVASVLPVPLPWMTGSLLIVALVVAVFGTRLPADYSFPIPLRRGAVAAIGVAIGAQVTPSLIANLPALALSVAALVPFVLAALFGNYLIFRRIGGYDRPLAFFAAAPGGVVEAIALGKEAGADLRQLTAQQFLRLILVLLAVPAGFSIWMGAPVGSAAGMGFGPAITASPPLIAGLILLGGVGFTLGQVLRLPAGQIIGPLLVTAIAALTFWPGVAVPTPLLNAAQVGVGASLGLHFLGVTAAMIRQAIGLAILTCLYMFTLTVIAALALYTMSPLDIFALIAAFAPGGVTEMSLVALSLGSAPAAVTLHHLVRITLTVLLLPPLARAMKITKAKP